MPFPSANFATREDELGRFIQWFDSHQYVAEASNRDGLREDQAKPSNCVTSIVRQVLTTDANEWHQQDYSE